MLYELILRMALSLLLGFAIGFERKLRFKEAGIRTHTIVCMGACLFTLVSIYGFLGADSSRVAAQVVSGIGFIGAGMIFYHKEIVRGLTTAAGIWATAAIGMSVGTGMYIISLVATILVITIQCIMHLNIKLFHSKHINKFYIVFSDNGVGTEELILSAFGVKKFDSFSIKRENGVVVCTAVVFTECIISCKEIKNIMLGIPNIISINRQSNEY